jgi:glycosyltransferase involved in cell wall biosynthesis
LRHSIVVKVSIILPAYNEEKLLPSTLEAVARSRVAFERRGWESEVVVCNNNSTDRTSEVARAAGAMVVFEPINQIARARNTGAAAATGDWFLFIDADSQPSPELFDAVAQRILSGEILAGGALLELDHSTPALKFLTFVWHCWSRLQKHMAGSFIFCDAAAFREIGGFSHELFAAEELDLSRRLKQLARKRGQRLDIISKPRLLTSARKAKLYSGMEMARFMLGAAFRPKRVLGSREGCSIWYDGRR